MTLHLLLQHASLATILDSIYKCSPTPFLFVSAVLATWVLPPQVLVAYRAGQQAP
jgi:hypothetical protein